MTTRNGRLRSRGRKAYRDLRERGIEPDDLWDRAKLRAREGAVELIGRVSSGAQAENDSVRAQLKRVRRTFEQHGVDLTHARELEWVESAKGQSTDRAKFEELLRRIERWETRVVGIEYGNRIARNAVDGARLLDLMSGVEALIIVGRDPYDPRIPGHRAELMRQIVDAERENSQRTLHSADTREEKARDLKLRRILPTGLCWVAHTDPNYEDMAAKAGLGEGLLSSSELEVHNTNVERPRGVRWYVRFDPHENVYRALRQILDWLLDTTDIAEVRRRIFEHPSYPRPGLVPVASYNTFNPAIPPKWRPFYRGWLTAWLKSEALYGIYSYCSLAGAREYGQQGVDVMVPEAFPSFLTSDDLPLVDNILSCISRPWKEGTYRGARNHPLKRARCARRRPNGQLCGHSLSAVYGEDGSHMYLCGRCVVDDKARAKIHRHVDDFVLDLLRQLFVPDALEDCAALMSDSGEKHARRLSRARDELRRATGRVESTVDLQAAALMEGNDTLVGVYRDRILQYHSEVKELEGRIARLTAEGRRLEDLSGPAMNALAELTGNVPRLLENAGRAEAEGRAEGLVRKVVDALVSAVHIRVLLPTLYEVRVEFPSGDEIAGLLTTTRTRPTPQEREYISAQLSAGASPVWIARTLTRYRKLVRSDYPAGSRRGPWTAAGVVAVDLVYPEPVTRLREGAYRNVEEIAATALEPADRVTAAILADRLGPAKITAEGLAAAPTEKEIDGVFRSSAPARAARRAGWPAGSEATIADVVVETGVRRRIVQREAEREGLVVVTAHGTPVLYRPRMLKVLESRRMDPRRDVPPHLHHLNPRHWKTRAQLLRELPNKAVSRVCDRAPAFSHPGADRYFHASPHLIADVMLGNLPAVLDEMGYSHLSVEDFMHGNELMQFLSAQYGVGSPGSLRTAVQKEAVLRIKAERPGNHGVYYWVPPEVREGDDPQVVRDWFGGAFPPNGTDPRS